MAEMCDSGNLPRADAPRDEHRTRHQPKGDVYTHGSGIHQAN